MSTGDMDDEVGEYGPGDDEDPMTYDATDDSAGRGRLLLFLATVIVISLVGIIYVTYSYGVRQREPGDPPVIAAATGPERVASEDPGGLDVPHQDKLVYDRVSGEETETVERLMPAAEEPVDLAGLRTTSDEPEIGLDTAANDVVVDTPVETAETETTSAPEVAEPAATSTIDMSAETSVPVVDPEPEPTPERNIETIIDETTPKVTPEPETTNSIGSATSGEYVVQVGSFKGADLAVAGWEALTKKHKLLVSNLRPDVKVVDLGDRGIYYRLRIGPFEDKASANSTCTSLKAARQDCLVTKP